MEKRVRDLSELREYTMNVEKELDNILKSLNWNQNLLLKKATMVTCKFDSNHRIPTVNLEAHEKLCFLKYHGYSPDDLLLPDIPPDAPQSNVCKLSNNCIRNIVKAASQNEPVLNKGMEIDGPEPLTLERVQCNYTADERRAIHDAVVNTAPALHDLSDLALPSGSGAGREAGREARKSRVQVLAELRDVRRRRARYRLPGAARYSLELRALIAAQMEYFTTAAVIKSEHTSEQTETVEEYNQDSRPQKRSYNKEDPVHRGTYNSHSRHHNETYTSGRSTNYSHDKDTSKERTYSYDYKSKEPEYSDRHANAYKHRKKYTDDSRYKNYDGHYKDREKHYKDRSGSRESYRSKHAPGGEERTDDRRTKRDTTTRPDSTRPRRRH